MGDLGSSVRSVYTAVGTCINLASRLQEMAATFLRETAQPAEKKLLARDTAEQIAVKRMDVI